MKPPINSHVDADFRQVSTAKAIYFFQLAQDSYRVQTILDLALVRCLYATRRATNVFPGLVTNPVRPGPPLIPGSSWFAEPGSSEVIKLSTMSDPFSLMDATGREECAVEELLSSLRDGFEIMEVLNVEYRTTPDAMALHGYIQSIEKWLASSTWIEKKIAAQLLAKTLLDGNMLTRYCRYSYDHASCVDMMLGMIGTLFDCSNTISMTGFDVESRNVVLQRG